VFTSISAQREALLYFGAAFLVVIILPFVKAGLLFYVSRVMRFNNSSYWYSLVCTTIGLAALTAVTGSWHIVLLSKSDFRVSTITANLSSPIPFLVGILVLLMAEGISVHFFFKQSYLKTIFAVMISNVLLLFALFVAILVT